MTPAPERGGGGDAGPAWAWVDHLRAGGTTPWLTWLTHPPNRGSVPPDPRISSRPPAEKSPPAPGRSSRRRRADLPGAAQLELVRRLAERYDVRSGPVGAVDFPALADLALDRAGPGRGRGDLPLLHSGGSATGGPVGAPATDPSALSAEELIRPGIGLLADLLIAAGPDHEPDTRQPSGRRRAPRRRPFARRFHLAGAPVTVAEVSAALAAAGHIAGGHRPEVVILAEPLDVHLAQVWSTRVQHGAPVRWRTFAARWAARDQLPPSAELTRIADHWAARVGPSRVHVVAGADPRRTAAEVLRLRIADPAGAHPAGLAPAAVDLLRRLNGVLNVRLGAESGDRLRRQAIALVRQHVDDHGPEPTLAFPHRHRDWVDRRADRLAAELRRGRYAVHGDLDEIAPRHRGRSQPHRPDVLALVLDCCLAVAGSEGSGSDGAVTGR